MEGTLFGNGERTGNLDIVTMALNMYSEGIDPGLDLYDIPRLVSAYSGLTGMEVPPRHPYAGELVFTAFSGSHQDAIKKGIDRRAKIADSEAVWEVPYLPIDPKDIGRSYEAIIRINSQSGKGGVAYILKESAGYDLPKAMHPEVGMFINRVADGKGKELSVEEIRSSTRANSSTSSLPSPSWPSTRCPTTPTARPPGGPASVSGARSARSSARARVPSMPSCIASPPSASRE